jgi:hypothetical protein
MNITTGKLTRAQKIVLYGPEGIGKTTFAAASPDPLFIDTEMGTAHLDVKRIDPAPDSWSMLLRYVKEVITDPGVCSTLVIDTADWAERLCFDHVLMEKDLKSIEDPGFGKGYTYVREEFGRLLDLLSDLVDKGVNVLVTAHAQIRKFELPDALGSYDRWELKLSRQCSPLLKEWADLLLFANYKTIIVKPDKRDGGHAKAQGGKRVMFTAHTPAWDAKNRCGLPEELPLDFTAIAHAVPDMHARKAAAPAPTKQEIRISDLKFEEVTGEAPLAPAPADPAPAVPADPDRPNLTKLRNLMAADNITDTDMQDYCAEKGYCTVETSLDVYPEDFAGYLVSTWGDIVTELAVPFN